MPLNIASCTICMDIFLIYLSTEFHIYISISQCCHTERKVNVMYCSHYCNYLNKSCVFFIDLHTVDSWLSGIQAPGILIQQAKIPMRIYTFL
jgi:hypothetical protein